MDDDQPLTYQYRRLQLVQRLGEPDVTEEIPVGSLAPSTQNVIKTSLPEGEAADNFGLVLSVRVYDAYGAFAAARGGVTVAPPAVTQSEEALMSAGAAMLQVRHARA